MANSKARWPNFDASDLLWNEFETEVRRSAEESVKIIEKDKGRKYFSSSSVMGTFTVVDKPVRFPIEYQSFDENFKQNAAQMLYFVCAKCDEQAEVREVRILQDRLDAVMFQIWHHGKGVWMTVTAQEAAAATKWGSPGKILCFHEDVPPEKKKARDAVTGRPVKPAVKQTPLNPIGARRRIELEEE